MYYMELKYLTIETKAAMKFNLKLTTFSPDCSGRCITPVFTVKNIIQNTVRIRHCFRNPAMCNTSVDSKIYQDNNNILGAQNIHIANMINIMHEHPMIR